MADYNALQAELSRLQGLLANALFRRQSAFPIGYADLERNASSLRFIVDGTLPRSPQEVQTARQELARIQSRLDAINAQVDAADREISDISNRIRQVQTEISLATSGQPPAGAGDVAAQAAVARDNNSNTQIPNPPGQTISEQGTVSTVNPITVPSNAEPAVPGVPTVAAAPLAAGAVTGTAANTIVTTGTVPGSGNDIGSGGQGGALAQAPQTQSPSVDTLQNGPTLQPQQSYVYKATVVTSIFERGKFTQELEGVLLIFPFETANGAPLPNSDTQREPTTVQRTTVTDTVSAGNMRPSPGQPRVNQPGASVPASTPVASTPVFTTGRTAPATSQGQQVGVFDWATVGQGSATAPGQPAGNVGFDFATVGQTGVASNQQLNRET